MKKGSLRSSMDCRAYHVECIFFETKQRWSITIQQFGVGRSCEVFIQTFTFWLCRNRSASCTYCWRHNQITLRLWTVTIGEEAGMDPTFFSCTITWIAAASKRHGASSIWCSRGIRRLYVLHSISKWTPLCFGAKVESLSAERSVYCQQDLHLLHQYSKHELSINVNSSKHSLLELMSRRFLCVCSTADATW